VKSGGIRSTPTLRVTSGGLIQSTAKHSNTQMDDRLCVVQLGNPRANLLLILRLNQKSYYVDWLSKQTRILTDSPRKFSEKLYGSKRYYRKHGLSLSCLPLITSGSFNKLSIST